MDLRVEVEQADGQPVAVIEGSIDIESRHELLRVASEAFGEDTKTWILDLHGVTFIDSTGIGALVSLSNDAEDVDGRLVLRNPSPPVARILDVTGLGQRWADV